MFWLFFWAQIALVVAGVWLVWVGVRGRPVDDHPHCRKCGYDLFGLSLRGAVCPECGAPLNQRKAVRVGVRERRRGLIVLAIACGVAAYALGPLRGAIWYEWVGRPAAFVYAVRTGDEAGVEGLLSSRPGLIRLRPPGQSLLDLAVSGPRGEGVVKRLLAAGAEPNEAGSGNGFRPLHRAAWEDKPDIVQVLLSGGADPNVRDGNGETPLHFAARRPGPGAVSKILLAEGADPNARDARSRTPLHSAASERNVEVVEVLIGAKADVNAANDQGRTPLHLAAARRNWDVSTVLLKAGAKLGTKDAGGKVPAQLAREADPEGGGRFVAQLYDHALRDREVEGRLEDVRAALRTDPAAIGGEATERPLLHVAAALGQTGLARTLLDAGADLKTRDAAGKTALHRAAWGHNPGMVDLLLRAGADANAPDKDGRTPLHAAADSSARPRTAELLLKAGADPGARDKQGLTPVELAATSGYDDRVPFIETMLRAGGRVDVYAALATGRDELLHELLGRDKSLASGGPAARRASPLHVAAWHGRIDAARLLLDHGADVNAGAIERKETADAAGSPGRSPLFDAIGRKHFDVAELLLQRGARVDVVSAAGGTALHVAAATGERPVKMLLRRRADPNAADPLGLTPLHLAAGYSDVATVRALVEAGADVAAKDSMARTALDHALRGNPRHPEVAAYLRSLGAPSHSPAPKTNPTTSTTTLPAPQSGR